jgi:hypothetical protein
MELTSSPFEPFRRKVVYIAASTNRKPAPSIEETISRAKAQIFTIFFSNDAAIIPGTEIFWGSDVLRATPWT